MTVGNVKMEAPPHSALLHACILCGGMEVWRQTASRHGVALYACMTFFFKPPCRPLQSFLIKQRQRYAAWKGIIRSSCKGRRQPRRSPVQKKNSEAAGRRKTTTNHPHPASA